MSIEYDEKGKYYTDVVTKVSIPAMLQTTTHLLRGTIHVRQGGRLKDELEGSEQFIALTLVEVCERDGKVLYQTPFLAIQKSQIVWIMPVEKDNGGS